MNFLLKILCFCLYYSGVVALVEHRNRNKKRIPILMYHNVLSLSENKNKSCLELLGMTICDKTFESQMSLLSKKYKVIGLDDFYDFLIGDKEIPSNSIVITFDDGIKNNYDVVFPILKEYGFISTFFIIGNYQKGIESIWLYLLYKILDELSGKPFFYRFNKNENINIERISNKNKISIIKKIRPILENFDAKKRNVILKDICHCNKINYDTIISNRYFMSTTEILSLQKEKNILGAHSLNHVCLSKIADNINLHNEIISSKNQIKQLSSTNFIPFSYPFGTSDSFNNEIKKIIKKSGMQCAFSTIEGLNTRGSDPFELKRIEIGDFNKFEFLTHVSGVIGDFKLIFKQIRERRINYG